MVDWWISPTLFVSRVFLLSSNYATIIFPSSSPKNILFWSKSVFTQENGVLLSKKKLDLNSKLFFFIWEINNSPKNED